MNLDSIKPRKFLSLGRHDLPHVGDLTQPYFVTIGCSLTAGQYLRYEDTWSARLARKLKLEHVNLAWWGSSLDYQLDILSKANSVLTNSKFTVWMHTYPTRYHLQGLNVIIGDWYARCGGNKIQEFNSYTWSKIEKCVKKTADEKVLHSNCWGYDEKTKLMIKKKISTNNKKYLLNKHEWLDRASDGVHAGPISHQTISEDMYAHIKKYFQHWLK